MGRTKNDVILIKKYANRRLYDTEISEYITLSDVAEMVHRQEAFRVEDAKTGQDLTQSVLTQIVIEDSLVHGFLLPIPFLRELIRLQKTEMRPMVPHFLNQAMQGFLAYQDELQHVWTDRMQDNVEQVNAVMNDALSKASAPHDLGRWGAWPLWQQMQDQAQNNVSQLHDMRNDMVNNVQSVYSQVAEQNMQAMNNALSMMTGGLIQTGDTKKEK